MPEYVTQTELTDVMPMANIREACEDEAHEITPEETWRAICDGVADEIHGLLAPRYVWPFPEPVQPTVKTAARWLTLERLYMRRGMYGDANPAAKQAEKTRAHLAAIGAGKILLDAVAPLPAAPPAPLAPAAVTAPMLTRPARAAGRLVF